jgi:hemin uptake protein HemP
VDASSKPAIKPAISSETGVPRRMDSRDLFGSQRRIAIARGDKVYRLQITRLGTHILTKWTGEPARDRSCLLAGSFKKPRPGTANWGVNS